MEKINFQDYPSTVTPINSTNLNDLQDNVDAVIQPIGSVYISSTNTNPSELFGGTWELIDKEFENYTGSSDMFTHNTTNCSSSRSWITRAGHTITLEIHFTYKVALGDTTVTMGSLNFNKVGVSEWPHTSYSPGFNDNANALFQMNLSTSGVLNYVDYVHKSSTNEVAVQTEETKWEYTCAIPYNYMLDSFCDKFYWKRTA